MHALITKIGFPVQLKKIETTVRKQITLVKLIFFFTNPAR